MSRNESQTCRDLIEPALKRAGWNWYPQLVIGPGKVNIASGSMYDPEQRLIADYLLHMWQMPLAVLEVKAESANAEGAMQQGQRYAKSLGLRFSIASNGRTYILSDRETGNYESFDSPPSPTDILDRLGRKIDWERWRPVFETPWYVDLISQKKVRPYQQMAIFETLCRFGHDERRVLLLMATGTGKTFTVFQLVWKLIRGNVLENNRVLFLTDRNSLQDQAYRAFAAFPPTDRVVINKDTIKRGEHLVGKIFFANYQTLDEELDGRKLFQHYPPDFFDLVVIDECHRSAFGDWFGVLEYFSEAYQLGLTATPRELDQTGRPLTPEELRRDTYMYFTGNADGEPAYTYSLKQAIEDGFLVPYLLEERFTNVDEFGYIGPDGTHYSTEQFEREIVLPDRTRTIATDLWNQLRQHELQDEKTIVFCVNDTHAAVMAAELRKLAGDEDFAARIVRSERNSHQLERRFAEIGRNKPRVAVTVDLLTTGFDAPDVKNVVFARPVKSALLYKQMKGRGTRLCEDIDKRFFTVWDYAGATLLEDAEFDGHPANIQKASKKRKSRPKRESPKEKPVDEGVNVFISSSERYVCLADGRKIPFDEYREQSKEVIRSISMASLDELLKLWIDRNTRNDLRGELKDRDIHVAAFRHYFDLDSTDDVDILAKVGFDLPQVPARLDRVSRVWNQDEAWVRGQIARQTEKDGGELKLDFWRTCLDHYTLYGIDDLERGQTYSAPQFVARFGNFSNLLEIYGGAPLLKSDLEEVKRHLYVRMGV
jgi:type I restriction enzyme, R subunit